MQCLAPLLKFVCNFVHVLFRVTPQVGGKAFTSLHKWTANANVGYVKSTCRPVQVLAICIVDSSTIRNNAESF